jgi:hypothetical protein
MTRILIALVVALCVGCGPNLQSGTVVDVGYEPSHTTFMYVPHYGKGGGGHIQPIYHPGYSYVVVEGVEGGKVVQQRIETDPNHNGLKVGDSWRRGEESQK